MRNSKTVSRRDFLRSSSKLAGAAAVAGTLDIARSAHAAGDDTLKVALIGCGLRGSGAVTQVLSTKGPVKLWAMADVFEDRIERSLKALAAGEEATYEREKHGGFASRIDVPPERRFVGFDAYKQAIDCGVDLVILATYPHFRPIHLQYAVQQGKHVFMEKPVAVDAPGVRQVLAAGEEAKKKNLKLGVGFQRHHHRLYQETVRRIRDGALGPIRLLRCYWTSYFNAAPGQCPPGMTEMQHQLRNPYCFCWLSGDHIVEQHVHNLDVAYWVHPKTPVSAQGMGGRQWRNGREHGDILDHHAVEHTYDDGSVMYSFCRHIPNTWGSMSEHVLGLKGSADVSGGRIQADSGKWQFRGKVLNPYQVEHDVLVDAIRNDKPHNEVHYSAMATMIAILGRMATYSGQMIKWEDALNSNVRLAPDRYAWDARPPAMPVNGAYPCAVPGVTKVL